MRRPVILSEAKNLALGICLGVFFCVSTVKAQNTPATEAQVFNRAYNASAITLSANPGQNPNPLGCTGSFTRTTQQILNCIFDASNKALYVSLLQPVLPRYTVATLPLSPQTNLVVVVTDGTSGSDCSTGGGSTRALCIWTGASWQSLGGGGSGGSAAFSSLTSGTNTAAAMVVGTGASLATSGSGTIAASTAAALAATPAQCTGNNFSTGISTSGAANCAQPGFSNLSGQATNAQLPNLPATTTDFALGLQRGSNLAPAFSGTPNYTEAGSGCIESAGAMTCTSTASSASFAPTSALSIVTGQTYDVSLSVSAYTAGSLTASCGGVTSPSVTPAAGMRYKFYLTATNTNSCTVAVANGSTLTFAAIASETPFMVQRAAYDPNSGANVPIIIQTNNTATFPIIAYAPPALANWSFRAYLMAPYDLKVNPGNGTDVFAWGPATSTGTVDLGSAIGTSYTFNSVANGTWQATNILPIAQGGTGLGALNPNSVISASGRPLLKNWLAKIGNIASNSVGGSKAAVIAYIGDSWVVNDYITGYLRNGLQAQYGFGGCGFVNLTTTLLIPNPRCATVATTGTWTDINGTAGNANGAGPDHYAVSSTDTSTPATKSVTAMANSFVIYYLLQSGGGSFEYNIDGGSWTVINTSNATSALGTTTISGLDGNGHTLNMQMTAAGTSNVTIFGVDAQITNLSGVRVHRLGRNGSQASDWIAYNQTIWQAGLAALAPDTVIISLGANDCAVGVAPATYASNLSTLVSDIQTAVPGADIILVPQSDLGEATTYPMSQYVFADWSLAVSLPAGFVDAYDSIGPYTAANARGLYNDYAHVSPAGGAIFGALITDYLSKGFSLYYGGTNQAFGSQALGGSPQTGANNTALGKLTLVSATTGYNNTAIGYQALETNTSGNGNAALGYAALLANTTGANNVAMGDNALPANTSGNTNVGVGLSALQHNTSGTSNVGIGYVALAATTTTNSSVGIGASALTAATGAANTGIGYNAGGSITGGTFNVAVGYNSGGTVTTGSYNTYIGEATAASTTNMTYETVVGGGAAGHGSSTVTLGRTGDVVGNPPTTYSGLPACSSTLEGFEKSVSDATVNTWGTTVSAGSGSYHVKVRCNGTNWTVVGI